MLNCSVVRSFEAAPCAKVDAALRHVVEQSDVFRHPQRMPVRQHHRWPGPTRIFLQWAARSAPIRTGFGGAFM